MYEDTMKELGTMRDASMLSTTRSPQRALYTTRLPQDDIRLFVLGERSLGFPKRISGAGSISYHAELSIRHSDTLHPDMLHS